MIGRLLAACLLLVLSALALPAAAEEGVPERHALVIGNAQYGSKALANPVRDAELMAATLKKLGFAVTHKQNLSRKDMFDAAATFVDGLPSGALAFFYFAGHGMQIGGANHLLPVDLVPTSEQGVALRSYPLSSFLERLGKAKSAVNLVVLDACRNNPFTPVARYRSFENLGLARTHAPRGTLVAYSTAPGQLAEDGAGQKNSFYTETLSAALLQPGRTIETALKDVAERVRHKTLDDQQPWFESSLVDELYLQPPPGVRVIAARSLNLAQAQTGRGARDGRGVDPRSSDETWFMKLNEREWAELDWEVQQRAKRLTADEIPQLIHKAKAGNVVAQTTLGIVYREGVDKATDQTTGKVTRYKASNTEALKWLRRAADASFPLALVELGEMYFKGQGVDRDLEAARKSFEGAARADYRRARLDLLHLRTLDGGETQADMTQMMKQLLNEMVVK